MRYSLLSRFRGTLVAAALGEELGTYSRLEQAFQQSSTPETGQCLPSAPSGLTHWHPGRPTNLKRPPLAPWGKAAVKCARTLVQTGRWNELEMAAIGTRLATDKLVTGERLTRSRPQDAFSAAECAIATLPLALFFHDHERKQQQALRQTLQLWQSPPDSEAGLLVIGYAIAQGLSERLNPLTLMAQTMAYLQQSIANPTDTQLDLMLQLEQTEALVQQGAGLYTAIEQLRTKSTHAGNAAIALAFYCFLSTPENLRLSLLRAARCSEATSVVCALTGALSGCHNSFNGLPLAWRQESPLPLLWEVSNVELSQLATHLFTVWSGSYTPNVALPTSAIAAPGIIRPR
ncbi:MAG: ADP-ribosylglycohydrolase family protein [Leptolyngbya sp. BL-A-14]